MQGLSKVCSVSVGTANFLLTLVLLIIVFLLERTQFKIGMEFALTCVVVSIGFPLLKFAGIGVAPNDALYLAIAIGPMMQFVMKHIIKQKD